MPESSVLILYTGGTIGCVPKDPADPLSPLSPAALEQVMALVPRYDPASRCLLLGHKAVPLDTLSWDPPIDSSQMTFDHWVDLAREIEARYDQHVGFVILHGTDTLAFTASALAFMLEGLAKPVVLTGSQLPIGQTRSDAVLNLVTAVEIAAAELLGQRPIPEVCVCFGNVLLRGCRSTKVSASSFGAFASPNFPHLGTAGELIQVDSAYLRSPGKRLTVHDRLESRIAVLDVFPGMSPALLDALLSTGDLKGVVLKGFGTGNVPATPDFLDAIARAVDRGIVILDVTQCLSGEVSLGRYETSAGLLARGVVGGMDLTSEAALAKLAFILGQQPDPAIAADLVQLDWRGEQRASRFSLHFGGGHLAPGDMATLLPCGPMRCGPVQYGPDRLQIASLLISQLDAPEGLALEAFLESPGSGERYRIGRADLPPRGADVESLLLEATAAARALPDGNVAVSLRNTGSGPISWNRLDLGLLVRS